MHITKYKIIYSKAKVKLKLCSSMFNVQRVPESSMRTDTYTYITVYEHESVCVCSFIVLVSIKLYLCNIKLQAYSLAGMFT